MQKMCRTSRRLGRLLQWLLTLPCSRIWILCTFCFSSRMKRLLVLRKQKRGFAPCERSHLLPHEKGDLKNEERVDNGMWNRPNQLDAALRFVIYFFLHYIISAISKDALYTMLEGWTAQYALQIKYFPGSVSIPYVFSCKCASCDTTLTS